MLVRNAANPLIRPQDIKASRSDFEVIGTFNAGAVLHGDEVILLIRVAERPLPVSDNTVLCPHLAENRVLVISAIDRANPNYDTSDPRKVQHIPSGELLLTSISHLRLARSRDGVHFTVDDKPFLAPFTADEGFGIEDARITCIQDVYYINYTAVSRYGVATAMATTRDFVTIERLGIIFPPANRDVAIFPERINGHYVCYHRPMPGMFGGYHIWTATSPDLYHWGQHQRVLEAKPDGWEAGRVGGGAPPIRTESGWLSIYHAADHRDRYCLGAFLTPHDQPGRIIAYSRKPILSPEAVYETNGFFPNVVFTCGVVKQGDHLRIYYGAADECIGLAETSITDLIGQLQQVNS